MQPFRYALLVCFLLAPQLVAQNWNQFRGPSADGSAKADLPLTFSEGSPEITWKTPVKGRAWSSPVVFGDQVWLTNAPEIQNPPGSSNRGANDGKKVRLDEPIRLSAVCLDLKTGKVLHDITVFEVYTPQFCHLTNSYASPTPCIEKGRLYVHFGTYGTACIDTNTGRKIWVRKDLNVIHWRGAGSSPVIHKRNLFLTFDGYDKQFFVALDKETGMTRWQRNRGIDYGKDDGDYKKAYSTPRVVTIAGRELVVSPFAVATAAYDAETGASVWTVRHGGMNASARPLFGNGLVYINAGDGKNALIAVRPNGKGDVTDSHVVWRAGKMIPKRPSQLLSGKRLFMVDDGGIASCLDATNGKQLWKGRVDGNYWSSPLLANGRIYCFSQKGKITVIGAGDEFEVLAKNKLDDGMNASAAVAENSLIVRTLSHVYRIQKAATPNAE